MPRKSVAPQRREQIIEALFQCLAENGHEKVTVKDIAKKAGLHYGVIHYYFKSKDDIVSELSDSLVSKYDRLLSERTRSIRSSAKKIEAALDFLVDEFIFNRALNRVFYNFVQMAFENKTIQNALRRQLRAYRRAVAEVIEAGVEAGELDVSDPSQSASVIVALIEGSALQWAIEPAELKRDEVRKTIGDTIARHLGAA